MMVSMVSFLVIVQAAISFTAIAGGTVSGIDEPRQVVVRTTDEWQAVWKEHNGRTPAPPVDFSAATVVGLFLGSRLAARGSRLAARGSRLAARGSRLAAHGGVRGRDHRPQEGDVLVVEYVERTPRPGSFVAQIITSPFHLVSVARNEGEVQFRKVADPPS